jgi:hypothetical protein
MIKDDNHSLPDDPAILSQMLIQRDQQIQLLQTEPEEETDSSFNKSFSLCHFR